MNLPAGVVIPKPNSVVWVSMLLFGVVGVAIAFLPMPLIALVTLGVAASILLMRHPWLIWLAIAMSMPFSSSIKVGALSLTDVGLLVAAALWFIDGARRRTLRIAWSPLLTALSIFIGALCCSSLAAQNLGEAVVEVVKWAEVLMLIVLIQQMVPKQYTPWLVTALLAGGVAQSLLGLYQFIYQIGPEWFIILGRFMRASGSFSQPNPFAGYMGLLLPVPVSISLWALGQMIHSSLARRRGQMLLVAILTGGAALIIGAALLASWSRGGWLGAAVAIVAVVGLRSRKSIAVGLTFLLIGLLILMMGASRPTGFADPQSTDMGGEGAFSAISTRVANVSAYFGLSSGGLDAALKQPVDDNNFAIIERLAHWSAALRMWSQAPWFGVGTGNYATQYPAIIQQNIYLLRWQEALGHAHNIYLNILAESGLVGLATYLLFWVVISVWLWQIAVPSLRSRNTGGTWNQALAIGVIGIVIHQSIHNLVDNLFVQGNYLLIGFWIALIYCNQADLAPIPPHEHRSQ